MNLDFYVDFWKRGFDFKGRSSREEYWYTYLVNFLISLILMFLLFIPFVTIIQSIFSLAIIIPMLAISVRRLHDSNRNCVPIIILFIVKTIASVILICSFVLMIFMAFAGEDLTLIGILGFLLPSIGILACEIIQIVLMCLPSTIGMNKYGLMREKLNSTQKIQNNQMNMNSEMNNNPYVNSDSYANNPYFQSYEKTYGKSYQDVNQDNVNNSKQN